MIRSVVKNERSNFYVLWQQHKQLKTMDMNEAVPKTYNEGYIHPFQPEPTHKIQSQQHKHHVYRHPPMEQLSNNQKDRPNQHKNSHKLCDDKGHPVLRLSESQ